MEKPSPTSGVKESISSLPLSPDIIIHKLFAITVNLSSIAKKSLHVWEVKRAVLKLCLGAPKYESTTKISDFATELHLLFDDSYVLESFLKRLAKSQSLNIGGNEVSLQVVYATQPLQSSNSARNLVTSEYHSFTVCFPKLPSKWASIEVATIDEIVIGKSLDVASHPLVRALAQQFGSVHTAEVMGTKAADDARLFGEVWVQFDTVDSARAAWDYFRNADCMIINKSLSTPGMMITVTACTDENYFTEEGLANRAHYRESIQSYVDEYTSLCTGQGRTVLAKAENVSASFHLMLEQYRHVSSGDSYRAVESLLGCIDRLADVLNAGIDEKVILSGLGNKQSAIDGSSVCHRLRSMLKSLNSLIDNSRSATDVVVECRRDFEERVNEAHRQIKDQETHVHCLESIEKATVLLATCRNQIEVCKKNKQELGGKWSAVGNLVFSRLEGLCAITQRVMDANRHDATSSASQLYGSRYLSILENSLKPLNEYWTETSFLLKSIEEIAFFQSYVDSVSRTATQRQTQLQQAQDKKPSDIHVVATNKTTYNEFIGLCISLIFDIVYSIGANIDQFIDRSSSSDHSITPEWLDSACLSERYVVATASTLDQLLDIVAEYDMLNQCASSLFAATIESYAQEFRDHVLSTINKDRDADRREFYDHQLSESSSTRTSIDADIHELFTMYVHEQLRGVSESVCELRDQMQTRSSSLAATRNVVQSLEDRSVLNLSSVIADVREISLTCKKHTTKLMQRKAMLFEMSSRQLERNYEDKRWQEREEAKRKYNEEEDTKEAKRARLREQLESLKKMKADLQCSTGCQVNAASSQSKDGDGIEDELDDDGAPLHFVMVGTGSSSKRGDRHTNDEWCTVDDKQYRLHIPFWAVEQESVVVNNPIKHINRHLTSVPAKHSAGRNRRRVASVIAHVSSYTGDSKDMEDR
jgi:hypothetical protein